MDIENLTIKEAREIASMFGNTTTETHPCVGKRVLVILPGRFIYMGTLNQAGGYHSLSNAQNIRYWTERSNGLGELAAKGPVADDKIDDCPPVWFAVGDEIAIIEAAYD